MTTVAERLGPEAVTEIRRQARIELARRCAQNGDILGWGAALFPDKFPLAYCEELHGYFVKIRHEPFTNTEAPRGHSKTTIKCFLIPIYQALVEHESFKHYLNVQATEEKALAVNRAIKTELERNEYVRELYGDQVGARWTDGQFVLQNGVVFSCLGAGQSIRGLNYNNIRPDYCIVDDLYDHSDINNKESTLKKNEWFWSDLYPALAQFGNTCMHVQGTAINKVDLLEELKGKRGVISRTFTTIIDWAKKIVLWPALKTFEKVMEQKDKVPLTIWEREWENKRRDDATSIIKQAWLSSWEYDPTDLHKLIRDGREQRALQERGEKFVRYLTVESIRIGNDPSIGKNKENDFTGTSLVFKTYWNDSPAESHYWIEDLREEKLSKQERLDQLKDIITSRPEDLPVHEVRIEAIGAFNDYADDAQDYLPVAVNRVNHVPDKITNLENKSLPFQKGRVHLNRNLPAAVRQKLYDQLTTNYPPHDDVRDGVLLAIDDKSDGGPGAWSV